jgi:hypothetical protein
VMVGVGHVDDYRRGLGEFADCQKNLVARIGWQAGLLKTRMVTAGN